MSYGPEVVEALLQWIASGKTLADFSRQPGMPDRQTVAYWNRTNDAFKRRYLEARDLGFDAIAEQIRGTARGKTGEAGDSTGDRERDRLICDMDLRLLAKWAPHKYGERMEVAHTHGSEDTRAIGDRLEGLLASAFAMLETSTEASEDRW